MKIKLLSVIIIIALLAGCSTSFDKISAEKRLNTVNLDRVQAADAPLKKPFKLAIFTDLETVDASNDFYESWDWSQTERKMISSYADDLKKEKYVSEYFFIPDQEHSLQDMKSIMKEAESKGADALVTIRGIIKVNKYMNPSALLDPTIIGALWLPGSNRDVMLLSHLDMWNMKSKEAVISVKSDFIEKDVAPTLLINTVDTVNLVKTESLRELLMQFKKKITSLKLD
ncbi:MAG: hypothetical protein WAX69_02770 [Victivallales bacterium]